MNPNEDDDDEDDEDDEDGEITHDEWVEREAEWVWVAMHAYAQANPSSFRIWNGVPFGRCQLCGETAFLAWPRRLGGGGPVCACCWEEKLDEEERGEVVRDKDGKRYRLRCDPVLPYVYRELIEEPYSFNLRTLIASIGQFALRSAKSTIGLIFYLILAMLPPLVLGMLAYFIYSVVAPL